MARYTDESLIGTGGFGEVHRCRRDGDDQVFAKKRLQDEASDEAVGRFAREVRILSSLDHPNIVRVVGLRLSEAPYFYVMPLYRTSLRTELADVVGDEDRVRAIFSAILDGIEYAHSQGVVHRDLKPENVLLNTDSDVVVTDFGLGRVIDAESTRMTQSGWALGTPLYMPPEQLRMAKDADERSDIFSLGRMLYELYTGPLLSAVQDTSQLPAGIAFIVDRCTKTDPEERFQSLADLKNAWHSLFDGAFRQSERDELLGLRTELSVPGPFESALVQRCLELLLRYEDDEDLVHETVMQLHADAVLAMYERDSTLTRRLLTRFTELAGSQAWGFSYTDRIADQCKAMFDKISDPMVRALLIECVLSMGYRHNRWHVLGVFSEMIESPKEPGEELAVVDVLRDVPQAVREAGATYVAEGKLHPELRSLFYPD